jgi:uncharacterized membrane protein
MSHAILFFHVITASIALLSGYGAMLFRKGSGLHGAAGSIFVPAMIAMGASGAWISTFIRPLVLNVVVGLLVCYLVSTAWWASKRRDGRTGAFDVVALLFAGFVACLAFTSAVEAIASPDGTKHGMPPAIYFVFGSIAAVCIKGDVSMLRGGGLTGQPRIGRHLRRMGLALLIASFSLYPGQARLFPLWLRETKLLFVPHILLVGTLFLWIHRVSRRRRAERTETPGRRQDDVLGPHPLSV